MRKPSVDIHCVAGRYGLSNERIIEVTFPSGKGCLVSLIERDDVASFQVYRADPGIQFVTPTPQEVADNPPENE